MSRLQEGIATNAGFSLPLAGWARADRQPAMLDLLALLARPGLTSFAHVLPAAELFPAEAYARATAIVLAGDPGSLQYGLPSARLKARVVELMEHRGGRCARRTSSSPRARSTP